MATYTAALEAALDKLFDEAGTSHEFDGCVITTRVCDEAPHTVAFVHTETAIYCLVDNGERYGVQTYRTPLGAVEQL